MIDYQRNGDGTGTLTITYTADQDKIEVFIEDLAESVYGDDVTNDPPFADLTNAQKLNEIRDFIKRVFLARVKGVREIRAAQGVQVDINL